MVAGDEMKCDFAYINVPPNESPLRHAAGIDWRVQSLPNITLVRQGLFLHIPFCFSWM